MAGQCTSLRRYLCQTHHYSDNGTGHRFPVGYGINAVGKMKLPNITSSLVYLLILPLSYLAMKLGANPTVAYLVSIICYPGAMICDVWILHKYTKFNRMSYYCGILLKTLFFVVIASILPTVAHFYMPTNFVRLCAVTALSLACSCPLIYYKGLDDRARQLVMEKIKDKLHIRRS